MRSSREADKSRVIWLVKFLEVWYNKKELEEKVKIFMGSITKGTYDHEVADISGGAYLASGKISAMLKYDMLETIKKKMPHSSAAKLTMQQKDLILVFEKNFQKKKYQKCIEIADSVKTLPQQLIYLKGISFMIIHFSLKY